MNTWIWIGCLAVFFVSLGFEEKKWAGWTGAISGLLIAVFIFISAAKSEKRPIVVKAKVHPRIDTIITIKNNVPDTTYVYTFIKEDKK